MNAPKPSHLPCVASQACAKARLVLAFLEVDFTTEREELYRRCRLAQGACEGTPAFGVERGVLGFERKVAVHTALVRAGQHVNGSQSWRNRLNVAGVAGEVVFTLVAEVAGISNLSAVRIDRHQGAGHFIHYHIATHGHDLDVAMHVVQAHISIQGPNVNVSAATVSYVNRTIASSNGYVAMQLFRANAPGVGM